MLDLLPKFEDVGGEDPGLHVRAVAFFFEELEIPWPIRAAYFLATLQGKAASWRLSLPQQAMDFQQVASLFLERFAPGTCHASMIHDLAPPPSQPPMHAVLTPSATPSPTFSYNSQQWSYPSQQIEQQQETSSWCIFCGKKGHKVEACWKKSRILQVQGAMTRQELDYEDDPSTSMLQRSLLTFEQPSVMSSLPDELATDVIDLQVQAESDVLEETVDSDWLLGFFMDEFGPDSTATGVKDEQCTDLAPAEGQDALSSNLFDEDGEQIGELELLFGPDQFDALSFSAAEIFQFGDGLQQPAATSTPVLSIRQLLQVPVSGRDQQVAAMKDRLSKTGQSTKDRLQQWLTDDEPEENVSMRAHDKDLLLLDNEPEIHMEMQESRRMLLVEHPPASLKARARRKLRRNRQHRFLQHPACSKVDALHRWMTDDELERTRWRSILQRPHSCSKDVLRRWLTDDEPEEIITAIQPREQDARQSWILNDELEASEAEVLVLTLPFIRHSLGLSQGRYPDNRS